MTQIQLLASGSKYQQQRLQSESKIGIVRANRSGWTCWDDDVDQSVAITCIALLGSVYRIALRLYVGIVYCSCLDLLYTTSVS
jgi:hypothetical protein